MAELGLQAQAERYFGFLVPGKGYRRTVSTPFRVRFESPIVFVELVYDGNRSYELGLLVGKVGSQNPPFTIGEILRLRNAPNAESFSLVQVESAQALDHWLGRFSNAFRTFGSDFILGYERSFAEIEEQRRGGARNYRLERELRTARVKADAAWKSEDYVSVVDVLKPFLADLTPSEVGKFEYAEKKVRNLGD